MKLVSNSDKSNRNEEDEPEVDGEEDNKVVETRRYPKRERTVPGYLDDYVTDVDDFVTEDNSSAVKYSVDYCYRIVDISKTYQEAISSPESSK